MREIFSKFGKILSLVGKQMFINFLEQKNRSDKLKIDFYETQTNLKFEVIKIYLYSDKFKFLVWWNFEKS